jgi:hypothetical protein
MGKIKDSLRHGGGYKKRYAVYAHKRGKTVYDGIYSEYVYDICIRFAREQFKNNHPDMVIDNIFLE